MTNAFNETKILFSTYTQYDKPLSYSEWLAVADDDKVAVLYLQFYDQITLAWYKTKSFYALEEDGVSTVLQYLTKNVPVLIKEPKRFTPSYMYKVAYNCLYCISHDIKRDRERFENETSNIVSCDGDELDLFDTVCTSDDFDLSSASSELWAIIEDMGLETEKVINYLIGGASLRRVSKKSAAYKVDPLADVSVSESEKDRIIEELREKLAKFQNMFY